MAALFWKAWSPGGRAYALNGAPGGPGRSPAAGRWKADTERAGERPGGPGGGRARAPVGPARVGRPGGHSGRAAVIGRGAPDSTVLEGDGAASPAATTAGPVAWHRGPATRR